MLKHGLRAWLFFCLLITAAALPAHELPKFTGLVSRCGPAVVNISATRTFPQSLFVPWHIPVPHPSDSENWFEDSATDPEAQQGTGVPFGLEGNASGSGFIWSPDGYIVTNHHVVAGAETITVRLQDGRELPASLVGSDERTDMALLKVKTTGLPVVKLGSSHDLAAGEWVLAIGSPFGFDQSVTAGIVSAKGRNLPTDNYIPFIQTDVAINPGNSGGPLFNLDGEVVGVNSQIYSRSGGFMGVSFAIPIDLARDVIQQLKTKGSVTRGWIGVYIQEISPVLAESFGLEKPQGALIAQVLPHGPAARVLEPGDIVLGFAGHPIKRSADLPSLVASTPLDTAVTLDILRRNKRETVALTVTALPDERGMTASVRETQPAVPVAGILGMELADTAAGVQVTRVIGEPARRAGIVEGDIIREVAGQAIKQRQQLQSLAAGLEPGRAVAARVQRNDAARFVALKLEAAASE